MSVDPGAARSPPGASRAPPRTAPSSTAAGRRRRRRLGIIDDVTKGEDVVRREAASARVCAAGLIVVGLTGLIAGRHPRIDRRIFSVLNHHRDEPGILRMIQQLGTPWVLPGTAVAAALTGHRRLAVAAGLGLPTEKALEVGLKKLRPTPRPLYVQPTVLRDDAPVEGESFPSGHAAIAWTALALAAPYLPRYASVVL